jgi:glutamate synthase (NADPH/NADH) small chain
MGQMSAFLKIEREVGKVRSEIERINDFGEFHERLSLNKQRNQAARCMDW